MTDFNTGIYEIRNTYDGKRYIGSALDFDTRFRAHLNDLRKNKHFNRHLQFAWNKYGEESFRIAPIIICSANDLLFYEQRVLDAFWESLYNLAPTAGSQLGWVPTEETKRKISIARTGQSISLPPFSQEHCANIAKAQIGKKLALETRRKMSIAQKRRIRFPLSDEVKKKISEAKKGSIPWNKGKTGVYSPETLAKISATSTGRYFSPECRQRMSETRKGHRAWNKGKTGIFSVETLARMSKASTGKKHSPETLEKMRNSHLIRYARLRKQKQVE